ncbi:hypothetical protein WR25_21957 [Diploscapter pachys]|uniref:Uncharacterized protein n=1 Tax=Diploscapter pachys TaxID=2018661 RepID=A0A2A2K595_9BILA|nr:hypothetical protein WR25_21957 [Diploscapter pachys]
MSVVSVGRAVLCYSVVDARARPPCHIFVRFFFMTYGAFASIIFSIFILGFYPGFFFVLCAKVTTVVSGAFHKLAFQVRGFSIVRTATRSALGAWSHRAST